MTDQKMKGNMPITHVLYFSFMDIQQSSQLKPLNIKFNHF